MQHNVCKDHEINSHLFCRRHYFCIRNTEYLKRTKIPRKQCFTYFRILGCKQQTSPAVLEPTYCLWHSTQASTFCHVDTSYFLVYQWKHIVQGPLCLKLAVGILFKTFHRLFQLLGDFRNRHFLSHIAWVQYSIKSSEMVWNAQWSMAFPVVDLPLPRPNVNSVILCFYSGFLKAIQINTGQLVQIWFTVYSRNVVQIQIYLNIILPFAQWNSRV